MLVWKKKAKMSIFTDVSGELNNTVSKLEEEL